jgi:hypothetical protein
MKSHTLLTGGALMVMLVLMPAAASAQRGSGRYHGGRAVVPPVVIVAQSVVVRPTVAERVVVAPQVVVRQPVIGRTVGFGIKPVRTGFGVQRRLAPVPVTTGRHEASRSNGFRALKPRHMASGVVVVAYPVLYPYAYPPQYGVTSSSAGSTSHRSNITVYGAGGVSEGPLTYSPDLAVSASSGLRFEVSPALAGIYVDGTYVGDVQHFAGESEPLVFVPGRHQIDLLAPGYRTTTLEVNIAPGQIIRYEGELEPLRPY